MEIRELGSTGIMVSRMCFGTLTLAPMQKNKSLSESREIFSLAMDLGVNFFDTADLYDNYHQIKQVVELKPDAVICTKSYDYTGSGVRKSLEKCLRSIDRDYVDLYLLHEQESRKTFEGHWEAIEELLKQKDAGKVRAIGISTHRVEGVADSCDYPELEVVFPLINYTGIGIEDGTRADMEAALVKAKASGKGLFGMKPFGGGNLLQDFDQCFDYILSLDALDAIAFGMQSADEVRYNILRMNGEPIPPGLKESVRQAPKRLLISDWCEGCGACVAKCGQKALHIENGMAKVEHSKCLTCGYCAAVCPMFCIKVI